MSFVAVIIAKALRLFIGGIIVERIALDVLPKRPR